MSLLITGCAGFIGSAVTRYLLDQSAGPIIGIDNLNDYYDPQLKHDRLATINHYDGFQFYHCDLADHTELQTIAKQHPPTRIIHLAAQAGVRYSLENPHAYVNSNLVGFANILEIGRQHQVEHLVYASSSSVYGNTSTIPFSTTQAANQPVSLYAATKKSNEMMAYSYSNLYSIPMTGLRYFTVYGPWGRPDMAPFKFTQCILNKQPIQIYNHGNHSRDFTYIDDIVQGTIQVLSHPPQQAIPHKVYNIGRGQPIALLDFINLLEDNLQVTAIKEFCDKQPGDVDTTWADISSLTQATGYTPKISLTEGVANFVSWYRNYSQSR